MRNKKNAGLLPLLFILLFIFRGTSALSVILGSLLFGFLPIIAVISFAVYLIKNSNKNTIETVPYRTMVKSTIKDRIKVNRKQINIKLNEFFKNNYKLKINDLISLMPLNGVYSEVGDLYLSINDELVSSLDEFGNNHPRTYQKLLKLLDDYSAQMTSTETNTIKKESVNIVESKALYFVNRFNSYNDQIPNEEISNQLIQAADYLKKIDNSHIDDNDTKVNKLYSYYLPMMDGILATYINLYNTNKDSEEFKNSEIELIKKLILINEALKTVNSTIHSDDYMNINAEMNVLESLLRKDGLVKDELGIKK
ncbi:MAG: hypothetical protein SPI53_05220 [Erysipelotrichaceae bacterium]|nr:hypothetical protein [Erysipelotrichaceae bacterium]